MISRTNTKRAELMQKQMVYVIIGLIFGILWFGFHMKFFGFFSTDPSDVVACQQSLLLASAPQIRHISDITALNIQCPAKIINVSEKQLKVPAGLIREQTRLKEDYPLYAQDAQFAADSILWEHAHTCYQKVFYGKASLFTRAIFSDDDVFCIVCSIITFDESAKGIVNGGNAAPLIVEREIGKTGKTLYDHITDHQHIALGGIDLTYDTAQPIGIIYRRSKSPLVAKPAVAMYEYLYSIYSALSESSQPRESPITVHDDGSVTYSPPQARETLVTDFEMIEAVPYTKEGLSECTILVSEVI
jgi:hypothetical protein